MALKELNECKVWLRMVCHAKLIKPELLAGLTNENEQLCRIINASITTARKNQDNAH